MAYPGEKEFKGCGTLVCLVAIATALAILIHMSC